MTTAEFLYRYQNRGDVVFLHSFAVTKRTEKGAWINDYGTKTFVLDDAKKRYAYPTKELAKASFLARKSRQLGIMRAQIKDVERAISEMTLGHIGDQSRSRHYFYEL